MPWASPFIRKQEFCGHRSMSAMGLAMNWFPTISLRLNPMDFTAGPGSIWAARKTRDIPDAHPELKDKVITPDVLLHSHSASLAMTFYTGNNFPQEYRMDAFAGEHGSWNRVKRTGYKVIRVPTKERPADR